jgi:2-polyprenyl-3-methyl-5-hydroxy-6-metoxy-1,4-benzoquinol methylase
MNRVQYIISTLNGKVLDVGYYACSLHEQILKKHGRQNVFGFDIEIEKGANPKYYKKGSAERKLPYKSEEFDTIIAGELLEHLKKPEVFLKEANRIIKKNGKIIITTPNRGSLINKIFHNNETPIHFSLFTLKELKALLEKNGFEVIDYNAMSYTIESSEGSANPWSFKLRALSDYLLPKSLREELLITARKK